MKPASFDYVRPHTIAEAASTLREGEGGAKVIAGGQSLGPMLNLRLVQPQLLVDIAGLPELSLAEETRDEIRLGACITAANIEDGKVPSGGAPMLRRIAAGIAYRAVRNRGTIGGSLCHADPAADWVSTLAVLGAACVIADAKGASRRVPVEAFMTAAFENALAEGEILQSIVVPRISNEARFGFSKVSRKTGKFAMAMGVVLFDPERDVFRAVMGATHGKPILIPDARELFGPTPTDAPLAFDEGLATRLLADHGVPVGASRQLHLVTLRRAVAEAFA